MKVGVPRETAPGERRVALVPDLLARLVDAGFELVVERPSGPDEAGLAELRRLPLAARFRNGYTPEELGVTVLSFVARA